MASREEQRELTRDRILRAAVSEFARCGFDGATVKTISERAEVAHGTVFWHFQNKSRLYVQAVALAADEFYDGLIPIVSGRGATFMQVIDCAIKFLRKNPETESLLASLRGEHPSPVVREATRLVDRRAVQMWRHWIAISGSNRCRTLRSGSASNAARLIASTVTALLATRMLEEDVDIRAVLADFGALIEAPAAAPDPLQAAGRPRD